MKDYAITKIHSSTKHPMANSLNYDKLKPEYRSFVSKLSECVEPNNFSQAAKDERWIQAMQQEIKALEQNNTWLVVDLPEGMHTVGSKWIYKVKYKANGEIERFKSRLVSKGYCQQEGLITMTLFLQLPKW